MEEGSERPRLGRVAALGLVLLSVLPFLNGLGGDFTYDDKLIIRDNPRIASPAQLSQIFTTHYFGGSLATGTAYRPLVLVTYALQRWVHGNRPLGFHVVNVLLHALTTLLLSEWLLRLGFPRGPGLTAAALFAVLPIHVEAVTGLVGRAEVLTAALVLGAACLWLAATDGERLRWRPYLGCLGAFLAAVFVKENAVVTPGVILLGELFRAGETDPRGRVRDLLARRKAALAGLLLPVGVLFAVRRLVLDGFLISKAAGIFDLENPLVAMSAPLRIANAAGLLFRYAAKTIVPLGLSADHSAYALPLARTLGEPRAILGLAGLLAGGVLTLALWKRRPWAAFGSLLFFGAFFPTANLVFPIGTIYAERLLYLPSAGLACAAVGLLMPPALEVPRPSSWPWREALVSVAVVTYGVGTAARNRVFASDAALYADMIRKVPGSAKAHYNYAYDAHARGLNLEARAHLERATAIFDRYYDAWALLGKLAWEERRWTDAVAAYRRSVEIFPKYENGRWGLAKTLEESGLLEEAERAFVEGVNELPDSYPLAYHYAGFLEERDRDEEARRAWARAVRVGSGAALARLGYARALSDCGREAAAWDEARRALVADPSLAPARLFLSECYEEAGKTLAASGELGRALRTRPEDVEIAVRLLEFGLAHPETRNRAVGALPGILKQFGPLPHDPRLAAALGWYR